MIRRFLLFVLLIVPAICFAQSFGFGFDDEAESNTGNSLLPFPLRIGGEIAAGLNLFVNDFNNDNSTSISALDIISAKLNVTATGNNADAYIALNFSHAAFSELTGGNLNPAQTPLLLEEAWLRGYLGPLTLQAGFMKLSWGRMFSPGPLDVTNPLDYRDLTKIIDIHAMKIARPMFNASWQLGYFTKIESVIIPNFLPFPLAQTGRWTPRQLSDMPAIALGGIMARAGEVISDPALLQGIQNNLAAGLGASSIDLPDTSSLDYFQTGLRFTTTFGPADFGIQYFYGNVFKPGFSVQGIDAFLDDVANGSPTPRLPAPHIEYSRFHQIGFDYAQVLWGNNIRAELAANITEDTSGRDGSVKNPFFAWSLGFDRDVFWEVNVNFQCDQNIRIFHSRVINNPALDSEAGTDRTATRFILQVSRQFLMDRIEVKIINTWDIEDKGFCMIPAFSWTMNDVSVELMGGIFLGDRGSELGQYRENGFVKMGIKYSF